LSLRLAGSHEAGFQTGRARGGEYRAQRPGGRGDPAQEHDRIRDFGAALPRIREVICRHLEGRGLTRDRVLAVVRSLRRRRDGGDQLLVYRSGPRWHDVTAADINDHLREVSGGDYTAKDFRTWHATVLAAVGLAVSKSAAGREAGRKRAIARVVREVADYLGNTPAVPRASYIDPRVVEQYEEGRTIAAALGELGKDCDFGDLATRDHAEKAVLRLLARHA
jgi:DNA topoisomerase IB